ncbi:hypothetical protein JD501_01770 [Aeromonas hydrophila]|uniref:DNA-binding protein n=1 Tax=Aeromonas hydrophila TaxID=644 RepID=UPI00191F5E6F|nr:DNA-binding protein [Aeromonas hydrophila]MBL0431950.1 hypothetical protein [Aeromonas hydrophila]MBL0431960.1 hypothetical protein [Aeromonas hydrophila]MBL0467921.1 hypothetical protein [Aeromonas hydrophila]MBL0467931.1 hypothetical protein [Aeromonas hydrophila]
MTQLSKVPHGIVIVGTVKGFRSVTRLGAQFPNNEIGVDIQTPDGWGGVKTETVVVRVSKNLVDQGVSKLADSLKEKVCIIPVYITAWTGKNGAGVNYNLSNHMPMAELSDF